MAESSRYTAPTYSTAEALNTQHRTCWHLERCRRQRHLGVERHRHGETSIVLDISVDDLPMVAQIIVMVLVVVGWLLADASNATAPLRTTSPCLLTDTSDRLESSGMLGPM